MGSALTGEGVQWITGAEFEGFWLIAARHISPRDLLERAGYSGEEMWMDWTEGARFEVESGATLLRAGSSGEWSYGLAEYGPAGAPEWDMYEVSRRASRGTVAVDISQTSNFDTLFTYAVNGDTLCIFDPLTDPAPKGTQPDSLQEAMMTVGLLDTDSEPIEWDETPERHPAILALRILEDLFSLAVPRTVLSDSVFTMRAPG